MQVVLIDDDIDDLELFCDAVLQVDSTIDCICFNNIAEFRIYLANTEVVADYIFCDLIMPTITGVECMRDVRTYEKFNNTKLVVYATFIPASQSEAVKTYNATVLMKPDTMSELVEAIRDIIK